MSRLTCDHCGSTTTQGYIYVCKNPAWKEWVKIGKTINLQSRLSSFNVGAPYKDFQLVHTIKAPKTELKNLEKKILLATMLEGTETRGEWRKICDENIINILNKASEELNNE